MSSWIACSVDPKYLHLGQRQAELCGQSVKVVAVFRPAARRVADPGDVGVQVAGDDGALGQGGLTRARPARSSSSTKARATNGPGHAVRLAGLHEVDPPAGPGNRRPGIAEEAERHRYGRDDEVRPCQQAGRSDRGGACRRLRGTLGQGPDRRPGDGSQPGAAHGQHHPRRRRDGSEAYATADPADHSAASPNPTIGQRHVDGSTSGRRDRAMTARSMVATAPATMMASHATVGARRQVRAARRIAAVATRAGSASSGRRTVNSRAARRTTTSAAVIASVPTSAPAKASDILIRAGRRGGPPSPPRGQGPPARCVTGHRCNRRTVEGGSRPSSRRGPAPDRSRHWWPRRRPVDHLQLAVRGSPRGTAGGPQLGSSEHDPAGGDHPDGLDDRRDLGALVEVAGGATLDGGTDDRRLAVAGQDDDRRRPRSLVDGLQEAEPLGPAVELDVAHEDIDPGRQGQAVDHRSATPIRVMSGAARTASPTAAAIAG